MSAARDAAVADARGLVTAVLSEDPDAALPILRGYDYRVEDDGADRLALLVIALAELAASVHVAWSTSLGLGREEGLEAWAGMMTVARAVGLVETEDDL